MTNCLRWLLILPAVAALCSPAAALDHVTLKRDGRESLLDGQVLVKAVDGGLLVLARDGVLWNVLPEEIVQHTSDDGPFESLEPAELGKLLLAQLPAGFEVYTTSNYVICYNTSKAYAQWCGALFEQLYRAFTNYWHKQGFDLTKPRFPLVAIVFADRASYAAHARPEVGAGVESIIGYYSLQTNRMTMYDLTGIQALRRPGDRRTTAAQINEMLARPEAEQMVATIVHEATHQIAFNCGLQTRFADIPLWVSEGVAVYFETPDLRSSTGFGALGSVNKMRLITFRNYLSQRPPNSLKTLIVDDTRFRDVNKAQDAYAEAWALNYFLIRKHKDQYLEYFKKLATKPPLIEDGPDARLAEFQKAFGDNLQQLDAEFLRYMSTVRGR